LQRSLFLKKKLMKTVVLLSAILLLSVSDIVAQNSSNQSKCDPPVITTQPASGSVCEGETATLTVFVSETGPLTYEWYNMAMELVGTSAVLSFPSANPMLHSGNYHCVITNTCGSTISDEVSLLVNMAPEAYAGEDGSVCEGDMVMLEATGGDDYSWSGGVQQGVPFYPVSTGTYTVTVTETTTGCSATDQVMVTLKPSPVVNGGTDQTVCENTMISFTATASGAVTPYTYAWSGGVQQSVPFMATMSAEYFVTVTAGNGCTGVDTVMLTVNPRPFASAGADELICAGSSVTLTASGGNTYLWSNGSINESITVSPTVTSNYIVTVYSPEMCFSKDTVVVVVEQIPVVNAGTNQTLCANNAAVILAGNVMNAPGMIWSGGNGYFVNPNIPNTTYFPSADEIAAGTVTLTLTSSGSQQCSNVSDQVTILFSPAPVVDAGTDQTLCSSAFPVSLSGSVTGATGGVWSGGNGIFTPNANSLTASYTPSATEINSGYVTLTLTSTGNGTCAPVQDEVTFVIQPAPVVNAGTNLNICAGETAELQATIQNAMGGIWTGGNGSFIPNNTSLFVSYTPSMSEVNAGSVTLTLASTGNDSCGAVADQITINIHANPILSVISANDVLCYNACSGSAQVTGVGGSSPYTYQWSFSAGGATTATVTNLCAEAHQVTVTDA